MPDLQQQLEAILNKRDSFIDKSLASSYEDMAQIQKELTTLILSKYISKFDYQDGVLVYNNKNLGLINELDNVFYKFEQKFSGNVFKDLGAKMLDMVVYSEDYFKKFGSSSKTLAKIKGKLDMISTRVGIDAQGNLIPNSYFERLAAGDVMKEQLKDYIARGLSGKTSLSEFQSGFEQLINGNKDVDGKLLSYWKTETHDAFFSVSRAHDDLFAQQLGMNFFIYLPGAIKNSRPFCKGGYDKVCGCTFERKIGQVFHRLDMKKWISLEWSGKKHPYNPVVDMGGWNCRHKPAWISDEMAKEEAPEKYAEYEAVL